MAFEFSVKIGANKANTPAIIGATRQQISTFDANRILKGLFSWGSDYKINTKTKQGQQKAYEDCSAIQSVIDKRAQYFANGRIMIDGKPIEDYKTTDPAIKLMTAPNPLQTIGEFINEVNVIRDTFGYCPVFKVMAVGSKLPVMLWAVNPLDFDYTTTKKRFYQSTLQGIIESISLTNPEGENVRLTGQDVNLVYLLKGRNPSRQYPYTGQSPIYSLSDAVSNFNTGLNVYGKLVRQSISGIIGNRSTGEENAIVGDEERGRVQKHLDENYGLIEGKNQFIVTNANLLFQSMLTNVGNLNIPAQLTLSVNAICDKLGFSPELMAEKVGTYENKKAAEIGHYQNETIPTAAEMARMFTEIIGRNVSFNYKHVAVLQEAEERQVDALNKSIAAYSKLFSDGLITQNEYLLAIGQQPREGGDKYITEISNVPLAVKFGVGGTTAIQAILLDTTLTPEQKKGILQVLFSISEQDASLMLNL